MLEIEVRLIGLAGESPSGVTMMFAANENGRWMFVTATSGVSQLIDPHGRVHGRLGALEQGSLTGILKRETKLTFYTRYGWLFPWCALGVATLCWLVLLIPVRRK